MTTKSLWCCHCQADIKPMHCWGKQIYPHRPDLSSKQFYRCETCKNYVGCHPGSGKPLGNIPGPELRKARNHIHAIIDPMWKSKRITRDKIYAILSEHIGRPYHTGEIKTIEDARDIYRQVQKIAQQAKAAP